MALKVIIVFVFYLTGDEAREKLVGHGATPWRRVNAVGKTHRSTTTRRWSQHIPKPIKNTGRGVHRQSFRECGAVAGGVPVQGRGLG